MMQTWPHDRMTSKIEAENDRHARVLMSFTSRWSSVT